MLSEDKVLDKDKENRLAERAGELFQQGLNCCESMIKSSIEILELPLPENTYLMGKFFREGIAGSGCICGAVAGGVMILGFLAGPDQKGANVAKRYKELFVKEFGSPCCRVLRKNQSLADRLLRRKCREITKYSAGLLQELYNQEKKG